MILFELLAEPHRRRIVEVLAAGERPVGELVTELGASQPAVSKQLRLLRDAGVLRVRRDGRRRLYSLRPAAFAALDAWLEPYRLLWSGRLDGLEHHLDTLDDDGGSAAGSA